MKQKVLAFLFIASVSAFAHVNAQDAPGADALAPGARIRFTVSDAGSPLGPYARSVVMRGGVTGVTPDSVKLQWGGSSTNLTVARRAMDNVEVSRGTQRGFRAHPFRVAYAAGLVVISGALLQHSNSSLANGRRGFGNTLVATSGLGLSISMFGISALTKSEKWERVPVR